MENELIPMTVYVKPYLEEEKDIYCLFDVFDPLSDTEILGDLYFYEAIERFPLHKYKWIIHYNPRAID